MVKNVPVLLITVGFMIAIWEPSAFAQFGGRGMGGIFGGPSRAPRGNTQSGTNSAPPRPIPDSYEQTEHRLALMEMELHLTTQQLEPWQAFANKVRAYASDLSRERARTGISEDTSISGLQHIDLITDGARIRLNELEDIRTAANALYATLSADQKKTADARMVTLVTTPSGAIAGDNGSNFSNLGSTTRSQH
jgi:LTXXQ motif family protein